MKWQKQGLIYAPSGNLWWAKSYAMLPTVDVLNGRTLRVYFAALDENRFGRIGYVDLDAENPSKILAETVEPILDLGELGTFDDSGVNPSCVLDVHGKKFLYYIGWQRAERVPYMLFAGLAIENENSNFSKYSRVPILDRTAAEPFLRSATTIIQENENFRAWYVSAFDWIEVKSVKYPRYVIKYATSQNGKVWQSYDYTCINFKNQDEFGFGRPWVIKDGSKYLMWYSIRSKSHPYCIGYAESEDGIEWVRKDEQVGINRGENGWDSEMICYPCVINVGKRRYMFYNGNQHGLTGFGYAVLES